VDTRRFFQRGLLALAILATIACRIVTNRSVSATQTAQANVVATTVFRDFESAVEMAVAATLTAEPTQDVKATVEAALEADRKARPDQVATPSLVQTLPITSTWSLISCHGRYVTAMADGTLQQKTLWSDCGQFTLERLDNGKFALKNCFDQYVIAPQTATAYVDWVLTQSPTLSDCGQFTLHDMGDARVAFSTCASRYVTAVSDKGEPEVAWYLIGHTYELDAWEIFTLQP
jgi:hypothetical protein